MYPSTGASSGSASAGASRAVAAERVRTRGSPRSPRRDQGGVTGRLGRVASRGGHGAAQARRRCPCGQRRGDRGPRGDVPATGCSGTGIGTGTGTAGTRAAARTPRHPQGQAAHGTHPRRRVPSPRRGRGTSCFARRKTPPEQGKSPAGSGCWDRSPARGAAAFPTQRRGTRAGWPVLPRPGATRRRTVPRRGTGLVKPMADPSRDT